MTKEQYTYVSLEALAAELGLPKSYLKQLSANKVIPCLDVNGRLRFGSLAVRQALGELASKGSNRND